MNLIPDQGAARPPGVFPRCAFLWHDQLVPKAITYPFEPKSITYLRAGQFWAVPLSDGRFGCGRVLHVPSSSDPEPSLYLNTRTFLAGLMDWSGDGPPTAGAIAGCNLLDQGRVHVAAITDTGSKILGQRELELDGLSGLLEVSHRGGGTVWLYEGGRCLRAATGQERQSLPVMSVWGRQVIALLAERHLVRREPPPWAGTPMRELPDLGNAGPFPGLGRGGRARDEFETARETTAVRA
jgi:hypothetical protein